MKKHKQNGFTHIFIFLIVIVIVGVAIGSWMYVKNRQEKQITPSQTSSSKKTNDYNWSTMAQGPYGDKVSFVISSNLEQWPSEGQQIAEHASVPDVILKEEILYVYFVDVSQDGKAEQIGLRKSSDSGSTWSDKQIITITGIGDKVAVDPSPFVLPDGRIRLYYFDISKTRTEGTQNNTIYSAISDDGINFTQEEGYRFKYAAIYDPNVTYINGQWRMYVGTESQQVLSAISADGLTFNYEGIALEGGAIPSVIYTNDKYYLFTGGIEISTSQNGRTFTKTNNRFEISGNITADPGILRLPDGRYFMVYKTK